VKKLLERRWIKGKLTLLTGLLPGGKGGGRVEVGSADLQVIRNPANGEFFIPGSSLKGKMRYLLELYYGLAGEEGAPLNYESWQRAGAPEEGRTILKLFGVPGEDLKNEEAEEFAVNRLSFFDLYPIGRKSVEEKSEVRIDRTTGAAYEGALVVKERVSAKTEFELKILLKVYEGDDPQKLIETVKLGLKLLEADYLGGGGSRGYGRVKLNYQITDGEAKGGKVQP